MRIVLAVVIFLCLLTASPPLQGQEPGDLINLGQEKFNDTCAACHRTNGEGLPDKFPALKGNPFVLGDPAPVVGTVLNGRRGRLGLMPAWKDTLDDREAAAIVSYIRQAWGNQAPPVAPGLVAEIRGKKG